MSGRSRSSTLQFTLAAALIGAGGGLFVEHYIVPEFRDLLGRYESATTPQSDENNEGKSRRPQSCFETRNDLPWGHIYDKIVHESELRGTTFSDYNEILREFFSGKDSLYSRRLIAPSSSEQSDPGSLTADEESEIAKIEDEEKRKAAAQLILKLRHQRQQAFLGHEVLYQERIQSNVQLMPNDYCGSLLPETFNELALPRFGNPTEGLSLTVAVNFDCPQCLSKLTETYELFKDSIQWVEFRILNVTNAQVPAAAANEISISKVFECSWKEAPTKITQFIPLLANSVVNTEEGRNFDFYFQRWSGDQLAIESCAKEFVTKTPPAAQSAAGWLKSFSEGQSIFWDRQIAFILNGRVLATGDPKTVKWVTEQIRGD